jgi:GNAT superfamily N-acetyltransferase
MAPVRIQLVQSAADRMRFIRFPWQVYRGPQRDPHWVPPLLSERKAYFDPARGPYYNHADVQLFLAWRGAGMVGTIAAHINHLHNRTHGEHIGFFGFFEVLDDAEAAQALLAAAAEWVRERGYHAIRGPMNFSINDECGLLIEGFDDMPAAMMTYNPPRYIDYVERAGFQKTIDLYAWIVSADAFDSRRDARGRPSKLARVASNVMQKTEISFRQPDMADFAAEVERAWNIYNAAWARNWGAIPMTRAEFQHLTSSFKPFLDPDLMLFAEIDGRPVGMLIAIPDINYPLLHMNGRLWPFGWAKFLWYKRQIRRLRVIVMGVLPEYRLRGIDAVLYQKVKEQGISRGYTSAEMSWILETNDVMNNTIAMLGGRRYKTYRIYDLPLTPGYVPPDPRGGD